MRERQHGGWWQRLGGPNAITLPAWLLTLPGAVVSAFLTADDPKFVEALPWLAVGLAGHLACGAVMFVGWLTVLSPKPRASRPWAYVAVVALGGVARGLVIAIMTTSWGLAHDLSLPFRLTSAPGTMLLWFSLATLIVDGTRRHRATMRALRTELDRERRVARESTRLVREYRADIVESTQQTVAVQLEHAIALSSDPDEAARHLRQVVDDVVRPLSHELDMRTVHEDELLREVEHAGEHGRLPLRDYFHVSLTARPFSPLLTAVIVAGTTAYLTMALLGPIWGLAGVALAALAMGLASLLARSELLPAIRDWPLYGRALVVLAGWCVIGLLDGLVLVGFALARGASDVPYEMGTWVMAVLVSMLIAVLAQIAGAVDGAVAFQRERDEAELRQAAMSMEWTTSRLRQQAFLEQRALGRALHGEVQARIVSVALQIQINPPADASATVAALSEQVREALSERAEVCWTDELDDICELWADAIALSIEIDPHAAAMLDADALAAQAVVEVVREAVTNAVRHGQADEVTVQIGPEVDAIEVTVRNDGALVTPPVRSGLGTHLLDAVCIAWDLRLDPTVTLQALIASQPHEIQPEEYSI